jgi:hypothetical protein
MADSPVSPDAPAQRPLLANRVRLLRLSGKVSAAWLVLCFVRMKAIQGADRPKLRRNQSFGAGAFDSHPPADYHRFHSRVDPRPVCRVVPCGEGIH